MDKSQIYKYIQRIDSSAEFVDDKICGSVNRCNSSYKVFTTKDERFDRDVFQSQKRLEESPRGCQVHGE